MALTALLVGTKKGCFVLESDEDRRDWKVRGPFCEGWPIYHAVYDPASGAIYAAAASEWHGAGVWRSGDLGESWELSSEGLSYAEGGQKLSKISGLTAAHGRLLAGAEAAGVFESRDGGATWSLLSTLDGQPGRRELERSGEPAAGPSRPAGDPARIPTIPPASGPSSRGSGSSRRPTTARSWTPRNRGLRADWPREDPEIGFCVHKLVMSPVDHDRLYQQNHCGMHRSDDGGRSWVEITEGLPTDFGFAAAAHPHDRDTLLRDPARPGPRPLHARRAARRSGARATPASTWQRLDRGLPQQRRAPRRAARGAGDRLATTCPASTSARAPGQVFASADEGESWSEIASYLPAISSVEVAVVA